MPSSSIHKDASVIAARLAGESPVMDAAAEKLAGRIRTAAGAEADTGAFARSIKTARSKGKKGVTDRVVYSDDPGAISIEHGHVQGSSYVPGKHIFTNTARTS